MRGGRNMVKGSAETGRGGSAEMPATWMPVGNGTGQTFGRPWNPQQEQMPLQSLGATG
ncbi:MAG TPA: hypothetical protein VGG45_00390 [Terracidiphilus sp.]|jgi:hypothetical protein